MLKRSILLAVIFAILAAGYFCLPKYTVEVCRKRQFLINQDFASVRKSLAQGKFEEEILKANNATMIEKQWINKGFHIERPLKKDRYWEFNGSLLAKIGVNNPKTGPMTIELKHDVLVTTEKIQLEANLVRPLEVGLTDLNQKILLIPHGDKTLVRVEVSMRLSRFVPPFMREYAQTQLIQAAENSVDTFETVITNLPPPKPGLSIPLGNLK